MRLPVELEREYGVFRARIVKGTFDLASQALARQDAVRKLRQDAGGDENAHPDLVALLAVLGISTAALLDQAKLKKRLRALALRLSAAKQAELTRLLGKVVLPPKAETLDRWVEDQARAITVSTQAWLATANDTVRAGFEGGKPITEIHEELAATAKPKGALAAAAASSAILALNSAIVAEVARAAGSQAYRWGTQRDGYVRENHQPLHDTIQRWDDPPSGGGTKPGDSGHPGSGWGCRCTAEPLSPTGSGQPTVEITIKGGS